MFDLKGRMAIVTGGNGGIGLGMARGLARAGCGIAVAARNESKSRGAVEELKALGADSFFVPVDVTDETSVGTMVETVLDRYGRIDILVNNAGMSIRAPVQDLKLEDWREVLETNLTGAFLCSKAVYPHMKKQGGGKVINIGSMLSIFGASYAPAYSASKGGIVQLTKSTAVAWACDNIQVNAVLPGWIDTDLTLKAREVVSGLHDKVVARTPCGRWGNIDDLAGIAVFLASAASDFVTGAAIPVDGGYSAVG